MFFDLSALGEFGVSAIGLLGFCFVECVLLLKLIPANMLIRG